MFANCESNWRFERLEDMFWEKRERTRWGVLCAKDKFTEGGKGVQNDKEDQQSRLWSTDRDCGAPTPAEKCPLTGGSTRSGGMADKMKSRNTNPGTSTGMEEHIFQWMGTKQGGSKQSGMTYRCNHPNTGALWGIQNILSQLWSIVCKLYDLLSHIVEGLLMQTELRNSPVRIWIPESGWYGV